MAPTLITVSVGVVFTLIAVLVGVVFTIAVSVGVTPINSIVRAWFSLSFGFHSISSVSGRGFHSKGVDDEAEVTFVWSV